MKAIKIIGLGVLSALMVGCEDLKFGNSFLEKPTSDDMDINEVFSYKKYADEVMNQFYKSLPDFMAMQYGYNPGGMIEDVFSDIAFSSSCPWASGSITAASGDNDLPYALFSKDQKAYTGNPFFGIRKAYIYLENVDQVPDMTDDEKARRKGEAKIVIANHYIQMIRYFGGMPWIDHAYLPDETFHFPRLTLQETVDKTIGLLDEAAAVLPWYNADEEYGHMTAAVAKALKFRLLLHIASPLFNANEPYFPGVAADMRLTWLGGLDENRWQQALQAGLDFLELNQQNGNYYEVVNTGNPREDFVNGYFVKGSKEIIMPSFRYEVYERGAKPFRTYEDGKIIPRAQYADMFERLDGEKMDWDNPEHRANPFFDINGKENRDLRLYETLLVNGDKWQGRKAEVYKGGREGQGSKLKQKVEFGYGYRKFIRDRKNEMDKKPYVCPLVRMPEIYLNLAEIMNHMGNATVKDRFGNNAYDYLNKVHTRAGLPAITSANVAPGEDLLNYLLDERAREFGHEETRYFDLVRYKKGAEWATVETKSVDTRKDGNSFTYNFSIRTDCKYKWENHWYLLPFPINEMNKKYGLIQNPGWE